MRTNRRGFIGGLLALAVAPAVLKAPHETALELQPPVWPETTYSTRRVVLCPVIGCRSPLRPSSDAYSVVCRIGHRTGAEQYFDAIARNGKIHYR